MLYISSASPVPSKIGPARRNFHIIEQLCRYYDVTVLSLTKNPICGSFDGELSRIPQPQFVQMRYGPKTRFVQKVWRTITRRCDFLAATEPELKRVCRALLSTRQFDAVFLSSVLLATLPIPNDIPVIGDTHNVEYDVHRRTAQFGDTFLNKQYARIQERWTRREEQRCAKRVSLLLATSDRDRSMFIRELKVMDAIVVPNGIDLSEFAPDKAPSRPETVLFSGLMSYYPNDQAVRWFLNAVLPLIRRQVPHVQITIAGAGPRPWLKARASTNIEVTGTVPDMRPYIARSSVVVAPLHIGGGTRVKILEAQAMCKPVVSTAIGAEGLNLVDGESVLLADDPKKFSSHVVQLLQNPGLAHKISKGGYAHVCRYFS